MSDPSDGKRRLAAASGSFFAGKTGRVARNVCYFALIATVVFVGYSEVRSRQDRAYADAQQERLVAQRGLTRVVDKRLASEYSDKQGRLVADSPSDPQALLDPETLVMAHYVDTEVDTQPVDWEAFQTYLANATGKNVVGREYWNTADTVADVKMGRIHIVALHAADAPYLVNNAGFVPVAVLGTKEAFSGNRLDLAVAAKSKIKTLADIRGHKLTCTRPDSISGYRAAIAVLSQEAGLRPDVDYAVHFSYSQKESVLGLISGRYEVAALSDDKVQSLLKSGALKPEDYHIIYQSQVIPRITLGYAYNLQPELAEKVKSAALQFPNESGPIDELTSQPMTFFAIDYKKDFDFVRKIDSTFDPRIRKKSKIDVSTANSQ